VEVTRDLSAEMLAPSAPHPGGPLAKAESGGGRVVSASVRARKPALP
jgi:hypothetical protein